MMLAFRPDLGSGIAPNVQDTEAIEFGRFSLSPERP